MRLFDAHNHLQDDRFGGRQDALIAPCRDAGVVAMVVNGSCEDDWPAVADLARRHPGFVIPSFGLHPWYVHERTADWRAKLEGWLDATPGAVVGEIGLDRWILENSEFRSRRRTDHEPGSAGILPAPSDSPRFKEGPPSARASLVPGHAPETPAPLDEQVDVFRAQLEIAANRNLPASVHCLQAWGRLQDVLRAGPVPRRGFLLHSYGGPAELVGPMARLGARFSFPGYFLHERKARQRETFRSIPPDRLLVETDAPDQCLPAPPLELHDPEGRPLNHPANLGAVYAGLSALLGQDAEALADSVEANFRTLFG